ncbi:MAG: zf-TFIIB domain-containing protein [Chloroflexi bacterium]|nr:zf-TFIIB domain-containing protein [Chloroflexota bacterium]
MEPETTGYRQHIRNVGIDETNGRYGEVELFQCEQCHGYWLRYFVEYEHLTASGRHFWGLITLEQAQNVTPDKAVSILESLEWVLYGGSYYYGKRGRRQNYPGQHLPVDE